MVIVPVVAPAGTVVEMEVAVLVSTVANVPLKLTMLLAGVILKLVPAIVTGVPNASLTRPTANA